MDLPNLARHLILQFIIEVISNFGIILGILLLSVLGINRLFIPIGVLFIGIYNILTQWALRKKILKRYQKQK